MRAPGSGSVRPADVRMAGVADDLMVRPGLFEQGEADGSAIEPLEIAAAAQREQQHTGDQEDNPEPAKDAKLFADQDRGCMLSAAGACAGTGERAAPEGLQPVQGSER